MLSPHTLADLSSEQSIILEHRFVYGRGIAETLATLNENGALLIEERVGDETRIIAITTREGQRCLREFLTMLETPS